MIELSSLQALLREEFPIVREFGTLMKCRTQENEHHAVCEDCGFYHTFDYHCNKRFCPCCAWQISCERRNVLDACAHLIKDARHVTVTARNDDNCRAMLQKILSGVRKLLRREILSSVRGGWVTFECTNESRGWHWHAHMLLDSPFIPADQLAINWAQCIGQEFAIVKVKRAKNYLAEVTKYTVKPSVFNGWPQSQRTEFVKAIRGRRLFFAFGHVKEATSNVRANINASRRERGQCCKVPVITPVATIYKRFK